MLTTDKVILMHPLMLHSASHNNLRSPLIIINPPVSLASPFRFKREDQRYSLVELKTTRELGTDVDRGYELEVTSETKAVIPERLNYRQSGRRTS